MRGRFIPACPTGPSKVKPSMKLGVIAASFLPRVIISPRFWNLKCKDKINCELGLQKYNFQADQAQYENIQAALVSNF